MTAVPLLYKVLTDDGLPAHGGTGAWPLPKGEKPSAWHTVDGDLSICWNGLHLTSDPLRWWKPGARLYLAEPDIASGIASDSTDKAAFRRVRLVREITRAWPYLPMFARVRCFLAASERTHDENTDISWANLRWANLSEADLSGADLSEAHLSGANLRWANLREAHLSGANLRGADLSEADLSEADLSGANLRWANLRWAHLSGANLREADLVGAYRPSDPPDGWTPNADGRLQQSPPA